MIYTLGIKNEWFQNITLKECKKLLSQMEEISCDTETHGFDPYTKNLMCIQLGDKKNQFVIHPRYLYSLKDLLEEKLLLFQNAKFDLKFLYHNGIYPNRVYDTYLAECVISCGIKTHRRGLAAIAMNRLGVNLDKSVRDNIWTEGLTKRVIEYAADDVKYLQDIRDSQKKDLDKWNLHKALEIENEFVLCLAYIEYCGFKLDREKWSGKCEQDLVNLKESEKALHEFVIKNNLTKYIDFQGDLFSQELKSRLNWNSPKQVIELFRDLGIPVENEEEKDSLEAKNIERWQEQFPIVKDYLHYKEMQKLVSTYGYNFIEQINPITGRLHTQFTQIMDTGRLSSGGRNRETGEKYLNFQNIPADKETRSCFIASEGNVLIGCDYKAQEDYVFTELSQEPELIHFYNDTKERDGHSFVAKLCFPEELKDIPEELVKKERPDLRNSGKVGKFSIHYGGNGDTVARNLNISKEKGYEIEKAYFTAFGGIKTYFDKVKTETLRNGYVLINKLTHRKTFLPFFDNFKKLEKELTKEFWEKYRDQKRKFENNEEAPYLEVMREKVKRYFKVKGSMERKAQNYPTQSTAAEITKISCIKIFKWIKENNYIGKVLFVNTIHDENLLDCPEELAPIVAPIVQKSMEDAGAIYCKVVRLQAVPEISAYWTK